MRQTTRFHSSKQTTQSRWGRSNQRGGRGGLSLRPPLSGIGMVDEGAFSGTLQRLGGEGPQFGQRDNSRQALPVEAQGACVQTVPRRDEFPGAMHELAAEKRNEAGLPDGLKAGIERLAGMSMDAVRVHYNSSKPAQLNALAYAKGNEIHLGSGQERHLPHEAWHVVQQKQGRVRPTLQAKGVAINDDAGLEREADELGNRAARAPLERVQYMTQSVTEAQRQGERTEALKDIHEPARASGKQVRQRMVDQSLAVTQRMGSGDGVVQMKGYILSLAEDAKAIGEQEVGTGQTIQFTNFTSCIGVIGKKDDGTLVGIHLVRVGSHGGPFDAEDVPTVKALLLGLSGITIIGQTDFWEEELLAAIGGDVVGGTDDGSFSATTDKTGKIVVKKQS